MSNEECRVEEGDILNADGAARLLNVNKSSVFRMARDGRLPCYRLPGSRLVRFSRQKLMAWLETGASGTSIETSSRS